MPRLFHGGESMSTEFSRTLSLLRKERGVSQRMAAADLGVSQALLSHYENGIREPGLAFVVKACDYYHVSADYMLGRTLARDGSMLTPEEILEYVLVGEDGPAHDRVFTMEVRLNSNVLGKGTGHSKREAEQYAARMALEYFEDEDKA